jgi:hypothetical protein
MNKLHLFLVTLAVTVLLIVVAQRKDDPAQFEEISHSTYPEAINTWRFIHSASASGDVKLLRMDHQQAVLENADSEVLAKMEGQLPYAIFSAKGSRFATVRSLQKPDITRQITEWQIDFFDAALNKKYSVRMPRFIDESEPVIALSEKGDDWLSGRSAMGTIELWQGEKRRMANLVLFADAEHDLERTLLIRYQPSGQKFAVLASKRGAAPADSPAKNPNGEPYLFIFSADGKLLSQIALPGYAANRLVVSDAAILVNSYKVYEKTGNIERKALLFNWEGRLQWETDLLFKTAGFSEDGNKVFLADNQRAMAYDLNTQFVLWEQHFSDAERQIVGGAISNNAETAILLAKNTFADGRFQFVSPVLQIIQQTGRQLQTLSFETETLQNPAVWLSPKGERLLIGFQHSLYQFRKKL